MIINPTRPSSPDLPQIPVEETKKRAREEGPQDGNTSMANQSDKYGTLNHNSPRKCKAAYSTNTQPSHLISSCYGLCSFVNFCLTSHS